MAHLLDLSREASLTRRGWLSGQPRSFATAVLNRVRWRSVERAASIFHQGDEIGGCYGVLSGGIGMMATNDFNGPVLGHILRTGDWFGYGPMLTGRVRAFTVRAMEPTILAHLPFAAMAELEDLDPRLARCFAGLAEYGADTARCVVADALIRRADQRIAATLLRVTAVREGMVPDSPDGFLISQAELAEMANASRNYVNLTLKGFADRGWVAPGYHRIALIDIEALSAFAASG